MSAIKSTDEKTYLGTMSERQAAILLKHRQRIIELRGLLKRSEEDYRDLLAISMPAGANGFDDNTMSWFYDPARVPQGPPPPVEPEDVEEEQD